MFSTIDTRRTSVYGSTELGRGSCVYDMAVRVQSRAVRRSFMAVCVLADETVTGVCGYGNPH